MKVLERMKKGFPACLGILFCMTITFWAGVAKQVDAREAEYEDFTTLPLLRFHIRANSNEAKDQEIKLAVRDEVISYIRDLCPEADSKEVLRNEVLAHRKELEAIVSNTMKRYGVESRASIYFTKEFFPIRTYGETIVPAGYYEALRIDLNQGKGKNWWCVLYPNFCLIGEKYALDDPEKKDEMEQLLKEGKVIYKSRLLEWLKSIEKRR